MEKLFINKESFSKEVEELVIEKNIGYMDAIVFICEDRNIEIETAARHVNKIIKGKLEVEAQELNYLPSSNRLPGL